MRIRYLDGPRLRRSLIAACEHAQSQRGELNRINVFPVPDGDTGTNLALTVRAIADRLRDNRDASVAAVASTAAEAAVLGARGNCGMMLSHFLLGFAGRLEGLEEVDADGFAEALRAGADALQAALERPVEGTILTVMRETAQAAETRGVADFAALVEELVEEARAALARTPDALKVLRDAGVVDAGAKGFVSLLEGVHLYIEGEGGAVPVVRVSGSPDAAPVARIEYAEGAEQYRYCTEALVRGDALPSQDAVRAALRDRGDSLIVIRSGSVLKVHIHSDDPEGVFGYLRGLGTLATHKAEDMHAQHAAVGRAADRHVTLARRPVVVLTDSAADLSDEIVRAHGVHVTPLVMVDGDETYRDGIDVTAEDFHRKLASADTLPTTSQPAPADFLECMRAAAEEGEAIVGVVLGSTLSGTFTSAEAAAARFDGAPVHLVDSLGASLLQGLLVLKACELAELATPPELIVETLERTRRRSGILFTVDTFDRLRASGRVGLGRALLASLLGLKPILGLIETGQVVVLGKRWGRPGARRALLRALDERVDVGTGRVRFGVVHVGNPGIVEPVSERLRARYGAHVEILAAPATPVIATHLGIGAWGVAYMVEEGAQL